MAHYSAKSRLFSELSRSRTSSPNAEDFATAGSFDIRNDQIINSTMNMDDHSRQGLPLHYDQHPHTYEPSDPGSEGSADMSIEIGRGAKRGARDQDGDMSSNMAFNFGGDSQYEVTGTPPIRPRTASRKSDGILRREASIRHASTTAKNLEVPRRSVSNAKPRSLSEAIGRNNTNEEDTAQPTTTFNARNTRFVRSRQVSAQEVTPRRVPANNPTMQSATYTANSFMLPDMPNITELVSGVRKDGTPVFSRTSKPSRSRFTSGSYKPTYTEHIPIKNVPINDDEKAIYSSLLLLKDKIAALESDKAETDKRAEEYEGEILDLRSQLQAERQRLDSALGSDNDTTMDKQRTEMTSLQAKVKSMEERCSRYERKAQVSEIGLQRVTNERDALVMQIGVAYYNNEELKGENEVFRESHAKLVDENEDLRARIEELTSRLSQGKSRRDDGATQKRRSSQKPSAAVRSRVDDGQEHAPRSAERQSTDEFELDPHEDLSSNIHREVQKNRDAANASRTPKLDGRHNNERARVSQSASRLQRGQQSKHKRAASEPLDHETNEPESTTEMDMTHKTRDTLRNMHLPSQAGIHPAPPREEDNRDLTLLSMQEIAELQDLRRKLEAEHAAARTKRNVSAPELAEFARQEDTMRSATRDMTRKSSLKDITAGLDGGTGRFSMHGDATEAAKKSVRVQSPQLTDGDTSMLSNISRRRSRAASAENMTSAFILPDITMHPGQPLPTISDKTCIQHDSASCTVCRPSDDKVDIPKPVPVTDRETPQDPDITTATIRPAQPPPLALAAVLKQLEDEITHLKLQLAAQQTRYHQHDPALSKRQRHITQSKMVDLQAGIDKRSDQVYALYDVLEGQKQAAATTSEEEVEETLMSVGIDPAELAGRVGRKAPMGLDGAMDEGDMSDDLPWEGLSEYESEDERM